MDGERVFLTYNIPLLEIITDFYDILKRVTSGYASFTYENPVYMPADLVRIDMLLNGEVVEPLVSIQHRSNVVKYGRTMAGKLKQTLKRGMFQIIIQVSYFFLQSDPLSLHLPAFSQTTLSQTKK